MQPLYLQKEPKNENLVSVQKAYGTVWAGKLLGFKQRRIRTKLEICVNSCLLITTVCCLHQSNSHIKRKLWAWRAQKYRHWVGSKSAQTCTGLSNFGPIRICKLRDSLQARSGLSAFCTDSVFVFIGFPCPCKTVEICVNSGVPIAMLPCLHQSNVYIKRKLYVRRA